MTADFKELHGRFDPGDMLGLVTTFPEQLADAWAIGRGFTGSVPAKDYRHVIVLGMGGSAIGGDMARSILGGRLKMPLIGCRDYEVPAGLADGALVVASSYSGNTGETLSAYDSVRGKAAGVVAVTSGGALAMKCESDGNPVCTIPGGRPPRSAIAYSLMPLLQVLRAAGAASFEDAEYADALDAAKARCTECAVDMTGNAAMELADRLHGRQPWVYSGPGLFEAVARRFACQFNENSKVLAHFAHYPELNHNEIVGWEAHDDDKANVAVVSLEDGDDHRMTAHQTEIGLGIVGENAADVIRLRTNESTRLARALSMMLLGDFASVYLAYLNGADPTPVRKIDFLKNRLKEVG